MAEHLLLSSIIHWGQENVSVTLVTALTSKMHSRNMWIWLNYSYLQGICLPIEALPDRLVMTKTTTTRRRTTKTTTGQLSGL